MTLKTNCFIFALCIMALQIKAQDFIQGPFQNFQLGVPVVADFDGDNKEDVLGIEFFSSAANQIVLQINNSDSDSTFFVEKEIDITLNVVGTPEAIDIDNDNDLDVVVARADDFQLFILNNDGAANFTVDTLDISGVDQLITVDFDNDGDTDIVGFNSPTGSLYLHINEGNQSFSTIPVSINTDFEFFDVGDLDQDNDLDIIMGVRAFNTDQIVIFENMGSNNFTENVLITNSFSGLRSFKIHDLNSDGKNDVVAIRNASCEVFINQENLNFERQFLVNVVNSVRSLEIGDYNGDGRSDLMLGTNELGVTWHENLSNTDLTFATESISGISPAFTIMNIDLNNDEGLDVLALNGSFWWLENNLDDMTVSTNNLLEEELLVFPNPFTDFIQLHNLENQYDVLEVFDRSGRIVYATKIDVDQIDLSALVSGVYFIRLKDSNGQFSNTIMLEKK